nr:hypothetical protein [Deltaproteobacteria bacterium]
LRARGTATLAGTSATGGAAGTSNGTAGFMGGVGRVRVDAPNYVMPTGNPPVYRGPMMMLGTSLISRTEFPTFVVTGEKNKSFNYYFTNALGDMTQSGSMQLVGSGGSQSFKLPMDKPLYRGLNHFCLLVDGASASSPTEGMNCFDLVYLYTP